jgi:CheY-like chemotaxis protein
LASTREGSLYGTLGFELARVLLVDADPTSRLTLQTVLRAGGYHVDSAASAAEAYGKLDESEYELVLSDLQMESPEAGLKVLAHARNMDYKPATALVTSYQNEGAPKPHSQKPHTPKLSAPKASASRMLIKPEDIPGLLGKVANLISQRAARRLERELRHTNSN